MSSCLESALTIALPKVVDDSAQVGMAQSQGLTSSSFCL